MSFKANVEKVLPGAPAPRTQLLNARAALCFGHS